MALSTTQKAAFNEAANRIEEKVADLRGDEAKAWRNKVTATTKIIKVLWNYQSNVGPVEPESTVSPVVVEMLGR